MSTRYPSRQEIIQRLKPELDRLKNESIFAEYDAPNTPAIDFHLVVGEKGVGNTVPVKPVQPSIKPKVPAKPVKMPDAPPQFLEDHFKLLTDINDKPLAGLKDRYTRLGWGIDRGNRIISELKAAGFVTIQEQPSNNPNGGRSRKIASLTQEGQEFLKAYESTRS